MEDKRHDKKKQPPPSLLGHSNDRSRDRNRNGKASPYDGSRSVSPSYTPGGSKREYAEDTIFYTRAKKTSHPKCPDLSDR